MRHDLAAPVIAGVLVSPIVSHWRSRKLSRHGRHFRRSGGMRPNEAAGGISAAFFVAAKLRAVYRSRFVSQCVES